MGFRACRFISTEKDRRYPIVSDFSIKTIQKDINDPSLQRRLAACDFVRESYRKGEISREVLEQVNNHVHTTYSFSPYEPAAASYAAWKAGLAIVGSVDHDSIGAAYEMHEASKRLGIASTCGFEVRCSFLDTPFKDKKINNPDSRGIVYMVVHGVKASAYEKVKDFLKPVCIERNKRNRKQVEALNKIIIPLGVDPIDFDADVAPLSKADEGGSITERHILYAFSKKISKMAQSQDEVVSFLTEKLEISVSDTLRSRLLDTDNVHFLYDVLGVLKGAYLDKFFIQPSREETIDVRKVVDFALSIDAIPAYAYLGDVGDSVTGDKKREKFEDDFLDELVAYLASIGFPAITYMPPRNTKEQMARLQKLCREHNLMEISGVDINSSRQSFNCPQLLEEEAVHLVSSAWALVAHEKLVDVNPDWGLFSEHNPLNGRKLQDKISVYAGIGMKMDPYEPQSIVDIAKRTFKELC